MAASYDKDDDTAQTAVINDVFAIAGQFRIMGEANHHKEGEIEEPEGEFMDYVVQFLA